MRNISLYENFIGDYNKLISDYRDFQEKHKRDKKELWDKYRNIIEDIFTEMYDNYNIYNRWRRDGFHSAEGNDYESFLEYLDYLVIDHFGDIELFNEKLERNPLSFKLEESQSLGKLIEDVLDCISKINIIGDSVEINFNIGCPVSHNYTNKFSSKEDINTLKSKVDKEVVDMIDDGQLFNSKREKNNIIIVKFYLKLIE
jgi:hypothetical protein